MTVTKQEAEDALRDIARTERRTVSLKSYQMSWPHLIIWGVVWGIGYGAMALSVNWAPLWAVLTLSGCAASFAAGYLMSRGRNKSFDARFLWTFLAIFAFVSAVFAILPPLSGAQYGAFFPILVALYYALIGIWSRGWRMLALGALLAALTLYGFFHQAAHFESYMAAVGGAGLILGGLWLRSA
ncbi:MAG TPA: hypothetical protein VMH86_05515 [Rhizomicrobium sp.]|nr:hypothetical protein [Rhizomicrobium sp.]